MSGLNLCKLILFTCLFLSGCIADQHTSQTQGPVVATGPSLSLPEVTVVAQDDPKRITAPIIEELKASTETTQNQLSGLLTTSISKLETNLKDLLTVNLTNTATANAELKAKLESSISALNDLKISLTNQQELTLRLSNKLEMLSEINIKLGNINTELSANATAQAGLSNKIESIKTTMGDVGHDVNMFPKQAVDVIVNTNNTWAYIICAILSAISGISVLIARNSGAFNKQLMSVLLEVVGKTHPDNLKDIDLRSIFKR